MTSPAPDPAGTVTMFGERYRAGDRPGELTWDMNARDLEENEYFLHDLEGLTVVTPDGSLLLSDDDGGRIYRIRWTGGGA